MTRSLALYEAAGLLLDCVCSALNEASLDPELEAVGCPCLVFVSPATPAYDNCCDTDCGGAGGQLTVHVESVFPSDSFPNPMGTFEPCKAQTWVATLVVTLVRCVPTQDNMGHAPSAEEMDIAGKVALIDHMTILHAISCCLVQSPPAHKRFRRVQIAETRSLEEDGGCMGIEVRALAEIGAVCSCPQRAS